MGWKINAACWWIERIWYELHTIHSNTMLNVIRIMLRLNNGCSCFHWENVLSLHQFSIHCSCFDSFSTRFFLSPVFFQFNLILMRIEVNFRSLFLFQISCILSIRCALCTAVYHFPFSLNWILGIVALVWYLLLWIVIWLEAWVNLNCPICVMCAFYFYRMFLCCFHCGQNVSAIDSHGQ